MLAKMDPVPGFEWPPDVKVVDSDKEAAGYKSNAYAFATKTGGKTFGHVHITDLYLKEVLQHDPDVIAQTIGHELGHIHHRHVLTDLEGKTDFTKRLYSQTREFEADAFGVDLMKKAGFSVVRGVLGKSRGTKAVGHMSPLESGTSTHPAWNDRFAPHVAGPARVEGAGLFRERRLTDGSRAVLRGRDVLRQGGQAWTNPAMRPGPTWSHARLMQYCDKLDNSDDLEGHHRPDRLRGVLPTGGFSLNPRLRGKDKKLWDDAVGRLCVRPTSSSPTWPWSRLT